MRLPAQGPQRLPTALGPTAHLRSALQSRAWSRPGSDSASHPSGLPGFVNVTDVSPLPWCGSRVRPGTEPTAQGPGGQRRALGLVGQRPGSCVQAPLFFSVKRQWDLEPACGESVVFRMSRDTEKYRPRTGKAVARHRISYGHLAHAPLQGPPPRECLLRCTRDRSGETGCRVGATVGWARQACHGLLVSYFCGSSHRDRGHRKPSLLGERVPRAQPSAPHTAGAQ